MKLKLDLTPQAMSLLKQLHKTGLFGLTVEEVAERFVYDALMERLQKPFPLVKLELKKQRGK